MKTKRILITQVTPGMIVADDVYTNNNQLIISKNTTLTNRSITRLKFYSVPDIRIIVDDNEQEEGIATTNSKPVIANDPELKVATEKSIRYSEQIRSTKEFKKFNKEFSTSVESLKTTLSQIAEQDLTNENMDVDQLLSQTSNVMTEARNGFHTFHMLQCMREYDDLTYVHSLNVSLICNVMGHWSQLSHEDIETLTLAGLLHDIGKLKMPQEIITKPSSLTTDEYDIIKKHPLYGYDFLKTCNLDSRVKNAALMHHERCDGSGYPYSLKSNKIDMFAKIVAIADTYDAMTSARVYRAPICPFDVISVFETEGLQKYAPEYLLPFLESIVQTYLNCNVRLSNGAEGVVIMINKHALSRPVVRIKNVFLDLSKIHSITITSVI